MFNPDKDFNRMVVETLGKDGKSISALTKDLETAGIKHHRLILTGYLRALTDMGILREKEVPPSKVYIPVRSLPDNIYQSVGKSVQKVAPDKDGMALYVLYRLLKRPIFESEMRMAGAPVHSGRPADQQAVAECKKSLRRAGNIIPGENAYEPLKEYPDIYPDVLADMVLETKDSRHLVMETKQTRLL